MVEFATNFNNAKLTNNKYTNRQGFSLKFEKDYVLFSILNTFNIGDEYIYHYNNNKKHNNNRALLLTYGYIVKDNPINFVKCKLEIPFTTFPNELIQVYNNLIEKSDIQDSLITNKNFIFIDYKQNLKYSIYFKSNRKQVNLINLLRLLNFNEYNKHSLSINELKPLLDANNIISNENELVSRAMFNECVDKLLRKNKFGIKELIKSLQITRDYIKSASSMIKDSILISYLA